MQINKPDKLMLKHDNMGSYFKPLIQLDTNVMDIIINDLLISNVNELHNYSISVALITERDRKKPKGTERGQKEPKGTEREMKSKQISLKKYKQVSKETKYNKTFNFGK